VDFKIINKTSLFILFFLGFLLTGFIPFIMVMDYTLDRVENELKSSSNESCHMLAEKIAGRIDRGYIHRFESSMENLQSKLNRHCAGMESDRHFLLDSFLRNSNDLLSLSLIPPEPGQPLHMFKKERIVELAENDPEGVASFFKINDPVNLLSNKGVFMHPPVILGGSNDIFLPMDININWEKGSTTRLRGIFVLKPGFIITENELPPGAKQIFIIDSSGVVFFTSMQDKLSTENGADFPIVDKILKSMKGKIGFSYIQPFKYRKNTYVGSFTMTRYIDWAVVMIEPHGSAYAMVRHTKNQIVLWALAAVVFCIACAAFLSWSFSLLIVNAGRRLHGAKEAAETANRMKSEFLANMSHELRTPLTSVLGMSEALIEQVYGPLNGKQISCLKHIEKSGKHLLDLINDILDLSKVEAGKMELDIGSVSVEEVCRASLQMVKEPAEQKEQKVSLNLDGGVNHIRGDMLRIKQILVNLLTNAVKFTPEGGKIGLDVTYESDRDRVEFSVRDTGIGIADQDIEKLFKPFVQLDGSYTRTHDGTGLGLALVYKLTQLHGGSVTVASEVGKYTRFTVALPVYFDDHFPGIENLETPGADLRDGDNLGNRASHKARILMADDNITNVKTVADYLEAKSCDVLLAHDGSEAVELVVEKKPDLILMDIQMPVMNGLEAIKAIRNWKDDDSPETETEIRNIPIIALTALAMAGDREKCLEAGADEYLSKPVGLKHLLEMIEKLING